MNNNSGLYLAIQILISFIFGLLLAVADVRVNEIEFWLMLGMFGVYGRISECKGRA